MRITEFNMPEFFSYFSGRFFYWLLWVVVLDVLIVLLADADLLRGAALGSALSILYVVTRFPTITVSTAPESDEER